MSSRMSTHSSKQMESYEHVLMCLICRSLFDDHDHQPKFLPCHHTFCKDCLREYVKSAGDEIECPSCRKPATIPAAGVAALQTNFYAKYIQSLVYGGCGLGGSGGKENICPVHQDSKLEYYCQDCSKSTCEKCHSFQNNTFLQSSSTTTTTGEKSEKNIDTINQDGPCKGHQRLCLTVVTEDYHRKIDVSFSKANELIEKKKVELEALLKAFSEEKDRALLRIDSTFEAHAHILNRRATLLKNKVIDSYNERVTSLESDLEEISTAMTCIVSLKEFHETAIARGQLADADKGVAELDEVLTNIDTHIQPKSSHVTFEEKHGADKFRTCVKDLGRVTCHSGSLPVSRPTTATFNQDYSPTSPDGSGMGGEGSGSSTTRIGEANNMNGEEGGNLFGADKNNDEGNSSILGVAMKRNNNNNNSVQRAKTIEVIVGMGTLSRTEDNIGTEYYAMSRTRGPGDGLENISNGIELTDDDPCCDRKQTSTISVSSSEIASPRSLMGRVEELLKGDLFSTSKNYYDDGNEIIINGSKVSKNISKINTTATTIPQIIPFAQSSPAINRSVKKFSNLSAASKKKLEDSIIAKKEKDKSIVGAFVLKPNKFNNNNNNNGGGGVAAFNNSKSTESAYYKINNNTNTNIYNNNSNIYNASCDKDKNIISDDSVDGGDDNVIRGGVGRLLSKRQQQE